MDASFSTQVMLAKSRRRIKYLHFNLRLLRTLQLKKNSELQEYQ